MRKQILITIVSALVSVFSATAFARDYNSEILSALKYLERSQVTARGVYEPGAWPTDMSAILAPSLLGVGRWGKEYPEATLFTTATIVSVLRQIQADDPSFKIISPLIAKAINGYDAFSQPPFFNFYPAKIHKGVEIRGPRNQYLSPYLQGLANIPPDADTTSVTYLSLAKPVPEEVIAAFARFRDVDRKPHYYDRGLGLRNTGAFMTWLMDEKDPKMPRGIGHPELGPRVPFGTNDVDCIVSINVMNLLASKNKTSTPGYAETCELIKTMIDRNQYGVCGIYYPSNYLLAVRAAEHRELGGRCLDRHLGKVLGHVLWNQQPNGSWRNTQPNRLDTVHSTALALTALAMLGDPKNPDHRARVERGAKYLLSKAEHDDQGNLYWKGQVFFSAVAQARFSVVWRSSSYTTVLAARALQLAEKF